LFSHVESDELIGTEDASSSLANVDVDEDPKSGDGGLTTPLGCEWEGCNAGEVALGLGCGSTTVVAELWLSFSFSFSFAPTSTSSAQLVPGANSDFRDGAAELSLAGVTGVIAPEVALLVCAEVCDDDIPFAA
jgi:hypothetical protein